MNGLCQKINYMSYSYDIRKVLSILVISQNLVIIKS